MNRAVLEGFGPSTSITDETLLQRPDSPYLSGSSSATLASGSNVSSASNSASAANAASATNGASASTRPATLAPSTPTPPETTRFTTSDPEKAHQWLFDAYWDFDIRCRETATPFSFRARSCDLSTFAVARLNYRGSVEAVVPKIPSILIAHVNHGQYGYRDRRNGDVIAEADETICIPQDRPVRAAWADMDITTLTMDVAEVTRIAAESLDIDLPRIEFLGGRPVSSAAEQHWRGAMAYVTRHVLGSPEAMASPIIRRSSVDLLAGAALTTFANGALGYTVDVATTAQPMSAGMRRAIAFIDDNADRDITVTDISAAARLQPRALQAGFRRHLSTTPVAYLRQIRLAHVHRELKSASPESGDTVGAIAARWGFAHLGRFAAAYQHEFGQTPSQTLRG